MRRFHTVSTHCATVLYHFIPLTHSEVRERYLDSVVAGVADENESLAVEQNSTRIFELTVESAFSTNRLLVLSRRREDLYPDCHDEIQENGFTTWLLIKWLPYLYRLQIILQMLG